MVISRRRWAAFRSQDAIDRGTNIGHAYIKRPLGLLYFTTYFFVRFNPFRTASSNADSLAADVLEAMGREDVMQFPVVSDGRLEGVISRGQGLRYLQTRSELRV